MTELPDPNQVDPTKAIMTAPANAEVEKTLAHTNKRKRGDYETYTKEIRAKTAKYTTHHGNTTVRITKENSIRTNLS